MNFARPRITLLSPEQIANVHDASLKVLASVGFRVESERARLVFSKGNASVRIEDEKVYFEKDIVEWAIRSAPSTYDVFNRSGEKVFTLGDAPTRFGNGVTNLFYQDPANDQIMPFARIHMQTGVRLAQSLPEYDVISTLGVLRDLPPEVADLYAVLEMVANATKPLVLLISDEKVGSSRVDLQACKLEYSIVSPK